MPLKPICGVVPPKTQEHRLRSYLTELRKCKCECSCPIRKNALLKEILDEV